MSDSSKANKDALDEPSQKPINGSGGGIMTMEVYPSGTTPFSGRPGESGNPMPVQTIDTPYGQFSQVTMKFPGLGREMEQQNQSSSGTSTIQGGVTLKRNELPPEMAHLGNSFQSFTMSFPQIEEHVPVSHKASDVDSPAAQEPAATIAKAKPPRARGKKTKVIEREEDEGLVPPEPPVLLEASNKMLLEVLPSVLERLGSSFDDIGRYEKRAITFMRSMTLLFRFKQAFVHSDIDKQLARLRKEEEDYVKTFGGRLQLLEMAVQCGYLSRTHTKRGDEVYVGTKRGVYLIEPRQRREPLDCGPSGLLESQIRQNFEALRPTAESDRDREEIVLDLQRFLNRHFRAAGLQVELFGSSGNLLYTPRSDLDLCCFYTKLPPPTYVSVRQFANSFRRTGWAKMVECIDHAKVPVVKFVHPPTNLHVDVSIENAIAIENTILIRKYAELDIRFQALAFALKTWCKRRCISNPSEGTLSSYSWTLMLIHFLQHTSPPVLPNLQATDDPTTQLSEYIHSHMGKKVICAYDADPIFRSQNTESVGKLLLGFFHYYAHLFNFKQQVITISHPLRQRPLSKATKAKQPECGAPADWLNKRICIEDPFIRTRNTGVGCAPLLADWTEAELLRAFQILDEGGSFADIVEFCLP
ncbi:hypothetical protein BCR37DRAFT_388157 [Protomyces lactucae-debilis]|uniref:polynucleotide adenylyltransferase n=1 Tax=Protomyces lactucae-debilis TaxID=2754530 RepID=A0A1Y2F966_PROLT|nr:uncharacterized protein BCR37DRAFT_388157 [Protomyces lactucae-debilis]ORY80439.1 hypothetical protein BCR37DRAFT_388157 [Protomyces lactucae-debilis]